MLRVVHTKPVEKLTSRKRIHVPYTLITDRVHEADATPQSRSCR